MNVELHHEAMVELEAAVDWYDDRRPGLGLEFELEIDAAMDRIEELPRAWPHWPGDDDFRVVRVHRFPYHLPYHIDGDRAVVMAIAHDKRRRGYWHERSATP